MTSRRGQLYVGSIIVLGLLLVTQSAIELVTVPHNWQWLLLLGVVCFSSPFSIRVPSLGASVTISEAFVFTLVLFFGPAPATIAVACDGLIVSRTFKSRRLTRTLFNITEPAIVVWIAAHLFYLLAGIAPLSVAAVPLSQVVGPLFALVSAYFTLNTLLTAIVIWFDKGVPVQQFVRSNAPHVALNYFASISLAALLVQQGRTLGFSAFAVVVPLLVMSYFSMRTSLARVEDANKHLGELNDLYLSTVETLAMAVDAKDQVTHGHIRRVQQRAVALARALGVKDTQELKAIEAAALLHDLGKLAIPEHILNKPGRLTPFEFEQMKAHATIGADILSRIKFPYEVTPIVRHHHEAWDGSGYPHGLEGEAIPLGARILSVVDCFDAVTSDRPYRPALSTPDALDILLERRGTMYDPRVVDTFVQIAESFEQDPQEAKETSEMVELVTSVRKEDPSTEAMHRLRAAPESEHHERLSLDGIAVLLAHAAKGFGVGVGYALFDYDAQSDTLGLTLATTLRGGNLRFRMGAGVTGWVGANRRPAVNSDAALDLGPEELEAGRFRFCVSVPVEHEGTLTGVLSLYAPHEFGPEQVQAAKQLGDLLAPALQAARCSRGGKGRAA